MDRQLRRRDLDAFCINEGGESTEQMRAEYITGWLDQYLRGPSAFEK